jgi:hypothetical protein
MRSRPVIGTVFYLYLRFLRPKALVNLATEMERVQLVGEEEEPVRRVGIQ